MRKVAVSFVVTVEIDVDDADLANTDLMADVALNKLEDALAEAAANIVIDTDVHEIRNHD